jgi:hypothetical protein
MIDKKLIDLVSDCLPLKVGDEVRHKSGEISKYGVVADYRIFSNGDVEYLVSWGVGDDYWHTGVVLIY